jgi:uncharacterized protein (TIGR03083 family)
MFSGMSLNPPGIHADSSAAALIDQLAEEWNTLATLGSSISKEEWRTPTSCPGWPVSAHYAHIIGTESSLLGRPVPNIDIGKPGHVKNDTAKFNELWVVALSGLSREEVLSRFKEVTSARQAMLHARSEDDFSAPALTPVGDADYRRFMQIRVFDCWVHEQDVRDAVGQPAHEEGPAAEQALDELVRAIGYLFGKKAGAPEGASLKVELQGPIHRTIYAAVENGRARTTTTAALSTTAFVRLACGRVQPDAVLSGALGGIQIFGDTQLARRFVTNLAFTI